MRPFEYYPYKQGRPWVSPFANPGGSGGIPSGSITGVQLSGEFPTTSQTVTYTAGHEMVILVDASGGEVTITLPTITGHVYWIKKTDSGGSSVSVVGEDTEATIDGESSLTLTLQYQYVMLVCDGTVWWILGGEYVKMNDLLLKMDEHLEVANDRLGIIALQLEQLTDENIKASDIEED